MAIDRLRPIGIASLADVRVLDAEPLGEGIVERLKWALALANEGKLSSVAIAVVLRDGSPDWRWSEAPNFSLLIGVAERMKYRMIEAQFN